MAPAGLDTGQGRVRGEGGAWKGHYGAGNLQIARKTGGLEQETTKNPRQYHMYPCLYVASPHGARWPRYCQGRIRGGGRGMDRTIGGLTGGWGDTLVGLVPLFPLPDFFHKT